MLANYIVVEPRKGEIRSVRASFAYSTLLVLLRGGFDAFPGGIAFCISHPLNLLESGDRV